MMDSRERFSWLVELMEIKPSDRILEVGCGVGFAVEAITPLLKSGKMVAIDRSAAAISKAIDRNHKSIKLGKATIRKTELVNFSDTTPKFDKIFCFNINLFWTKKSIAREMNVIKSHLKKKGSLYILFGPMVASGLEKIHKPIAENLEKEKFKIIKTVIEERLNCCCFIVKAM